MKPPAFQFYADDFLGGTVDLSAEDVGAYIRLICFQWNRGELPKDSTAIDRVAGCKVSDHVLAKFPSGKNKRLEAERQKQADYRAKQSDKGHASAQARLNRASTEPQPSPQPKVNSPSPSPSPSPISSNTHTPRASRWPTLAETKDYASIIGFGESEAELFWHHFESAGWIDKNGQPVMKWQSKLVTWNVSSRARAREAAHLAKPERAPRRPEQNQTREIINVPSL